MVCFLTHNNVKKQLTGRTEDEGDLMLSFPLPEIERGLRRQITKEFLLGLCRPFYITLANATSTRTRRTSSGDLGSSRRIGN
jgi:hypothetical protein